MPGTVTVEFLFDFGSLNAYLAHKALPAIERRTGAVFEYVPVLLGGIFKATGNRSPMEAFAGIKGKLDYEMLEIRRFVARHRIDAFQMNPFFPVNTLHIMRGAAAARMDGVLKPYAEAMFHHMWEAPKQLGDPAVVAAVLAESGLDGGRLMARSQEPDVKERLRLDTEAAVARGVFGAPTFFVPDGRGGSDIYFGKDRLRDVEEAIRAARE